MLRNLTRRLSMRWVAPPRVLFQAMCSSQIGPIEDISGSIEEILLQDLDFPDYYVNWAHPEDYKIISQPIKPEFIFHSLVFNTHARLLLRASVQLEESSFMALTFVVNTGAPKPFYFSEKALPILMDRNLVHSVKDTSGGPYVNVNGRNATCEQSPYKHRHANLMGLEMTARLGLHISEDRENNKAVKFGFNQWPASGFFALK